MSFQAMQDKENDSQSVGVCHRVFNFVVNSVIGVGLKRVTMGHPMPQGSTSSDGGVQQPLISQAELENSKPEDVSDSIVRINFKKTEEEPDYWNWTHVNNPDSSSFHVAEKNDDEDEDDNPQVHGERGQRIVIPITDSSKSAKSVLTVTGLGLNINEISETFIQNTKERLSRNVSLMEPEES